MSAELLFDDHNPKIEFGDRQEKFFKLAVGISILFHILGLLTSPWWQPKPVTRDQVMQVDIANVPAQELPQPKEAAPIRLPDAVKAAPPPPPKPTAEQMAEFKKQAAEPPPTPAQLAERAAQAVREEHEAARTKVRSVGLGAVLEKSGGNAAPPINVPTSTRVSNGPRGAMDYGAAKGTSGADPLSGKGMTPGIEKQLASASRGGGGSGAAGGRLSSKVFKTDTGMDAEISGSIDDQSRSAQAISAAVKNYQSGIKYAYTQELLKNQSISGKITVEFVIRPDGSVESVDIKQSSVNWPPLEAAIKKRISLRWNFGQSKGGPVKVAFPFVFHPEM
ncbi:MAG TPA: AgmX/PglI C-terminal domain-containing protein [Candidatus Deferrimicrobiaceae bacterium]|jgi:TonB family protein